MSNVIIDDPLGRRLHKQMAYLPALRSPRDHQALPLNTHLCGTTTFLWEGLRLLGEHYHGIEMLYVHENTG
ncbi:hypothetical protein ACQFZT_003532 [Providencia stuartii]